MDLQLEHLSSDYLLDEDFANIFYYIHFIQGLTGRLRVHIKNGIASRPPLWFICYSIAIATACTLFLIGFTLQCEIVKNSLMEEVYFKIGVLLNIFLVFKTIPRDIRGDSSFKLYVKLHKIDQDLNFKDGKRRNKDLAKKMKYVCIAATIYGFALQITVNIYCMERLCFYGLAVLLPGMICNLEVVVFTIIIYYISIRVDYINKTLEDIIRKTRNDIISCERLSLDENCSLDVIKWDHLLFGMRSLLTAMANFQDLHQYQIFSFVCHALMWIMITIQSCIQHIKYQRPIDNVVCIAVIVSCGIVTKTILFALCYSADLLSNSLEGSRKICVEIRHTFDECVSRRNAKRMLLLLEPRHDLSIYDIFTLGTRVSVKLLAIIATYTIVLLQLAIE